MNDVTHFFSTLPFLLDVTKVVFAPLECDLICRQPWTTMKISLHHLKCCNDQAKNEWKKMIHFISHFQFWAQTKCKWIDFFCLPRLSDPLRYQRSISSTCLRTAFTRADPKSAKKDSQVKQLLVLLGSGSIKAAHKHVDEIDPCYHI